MSQIKSEQKKGTAFDLSAFFNVINKNPSCIMIWGDVGLGKSTLALQIANDILKKTQKKIFYLHTKQTNLIPMIERICKPSPLSLDSNFILWETKSFQQQNEVVFSWLMQIQQLKTFYGANQIGCIIIDEISSQYIHELGSDKKNEKLNVQLLKNLATLQKITTEHRIPVIIINNFSLKKEENTEKFVSTPYGGKIVNYWISCDINLERTPQISRMKFTVKRNRDNLALPSVWYWNLGEQGFF